ncbi:MAG: 2-oxoglutarate dehydrogenase E1 subunit family protein, partial [Actinomycetes bacterium]
MYEQFLASPSTVDPAWHDFFADYRPTPPGSNGAALIPKQPPAPEQPPVHQAPEQQATQRPARTTSAAAKSRTALRADHQDHPTQNDPTQDTTTTLRGAAARVVAN